MQIAEMVITIENSTTPDNRHHNHVGCIIILKRNNNYFLLQIFILINEFKIYIKVIINFERFLNFTNYIFKSD